MSGAVTVIGLGATGECVARVLAAEGRAVTVVEDRPDAPGYRERVASVVASGATVVAAPEAQQWPALVDAGLVVPSPGIPPHHPGLRAAAAAGTPVRSEIDLAAERVRCPLVAVTGTNGKTTVTELVHAIASAARRRSVAAGNIGQPLLDAAVASAELDLLVAEVSSFQLAYTTDAFRPAVAVVLAIAEDHLDWHGDRDAYVAAKARVTVHQLASDTCVFDADDTAATGVAAGSRARAVGVTAGRPAPGRWGCEGGRLVDGAGHEVAGLDELRRSLPHDVKNALAAAAAARAVGIDDASIRAALAAFAGLPHRVHLVGEAGGVRYYDDSKATNPDATRHAVRSFPSVVLIAGGRNKGLDLGVLARDAERIRSVVALGEAAEEVAAAFAGRRPVAIVPDMRVAVARARDAARPGDVVLLSPGCASFDAYPSYAARGDDFAAAVAEAIGGETT